MIRQEKEYLLELGLEEKAIQWADSFSVCCCLDSNGYHNDEKFFSNSGEIEYLIAAGVETELNLNNNALSHLQEYLDKVNDEVFGFLSFDLKNEIESLSSENDDFIKMPLLYFFQPKTILKFKKDKLLISSVEEPDEVYKEILQQEIRSSEKNWDCTIKTKFEKTEYLDAISAVKQHIKQGDIYEMTLCQEFYDDNCEIEPLTIFRNLKKASPSPFSSYFKLKDKYILSASPERYLKRRGNKIISQPIKGTIKRSQDREEDEILKSKLLNDPKEQAENVMIVDLVRNDLSRFAEKGSVKVEELFGIYSFPQVHQMISTVSCNVSENIKFVEILKSTFPMGSMTGAPKVKALELIEKYEKTKRGVYSGSIGYINPNGDFDFNVIIRSILYNKSEKYLSFITGSAITDTCVPEYEYEECMLKASAMIQLLSKNI